MVISRSGSKLLAKSAASVNNEFQERNDPLNISNLTFIMTSLLSLDSVFKAFLQRCNVPKPLTFTNTQADVDLLVSNITSFASSQLDTFISSVIFQTPRFV